MFEHAGPLNVYGVRMLPALMASAPRIIRMMPMMNVTMPNGTAKQDLLAHLQTQQPNRAVTKVSRPIMSTGRAYPDWLMLTSTPKVFASGGTTYPN